MSREPVHGKYSLDDAIRYKNTLIDDGGSVRRVNSKLSLLRELFAFAVDNGRREGANPFATTKVSSKSMLKQQERPPQSIQRE